MEENLSKIARPPFKYLGTVKGYNSPLFEKKG
jgi:hypothetical protein